MSDGNPGTDAAKPADCRVCGGASVVLYEGCADAAVTGAPAETYRIARMSFSTPLPVQRCTDCGLGWAVSSYDPSSLLDAYDEGEDPCYTSEEAARRRTFRIGLERVQKVVPSGRLLDVGASVGFLLAEARDMGYEVHGLEPSTWAVGEAKRRFDLDLMHGGLETVPLEDGSFDVITAVDVIEHFVDPFQALGEMARLLRPGGVAYIVTPDLGGLPARVLGRRWWGFEPWHLWFFNRTSMARAMTEAGFEIPDGIRYHLRAFTVGYWLQKGEGLLGPIARAIGRGAEAVGIGERLVTLNLRDAHELVARKVAT